MRLLFQILFVLFALFAMWTVMGKQEKKMSRPSVAMWVVFWLFAIVVVIWPDSASRVAELFGIGRGVDVIIYIALAGLFYLVFKIYMKVEMLGRDITKVVRRDAVNEVLTSETGKK